MSLSPDLAARVRQQIEFYFSDVNLARDNFMKDRVAEDKEGFVPVSVFLTFKKIRQLVGEAFNDDAALAAALQSSTSLVVDATRKAVRRATPLPSTVPGDNETLYAKPIPADVEHDELVAFFGQWGKVEAIWRRRQASASGDQVVKPSVFVVFAKPESVAAVVAAAPRFRDTQLEVLSKIDYLRRKGALASTAAAAPSAKPTSPPMPENAAVRIDGVGNIAALSDIRSLWAIELSKAYLRYVIIADDHSFAQVIFQDTKTRELMLNDLKEKGATLNGRVPTVHNLTPEEDAAARAAAEQEIAERSTAKAAAGGRGSGRGRGGGFRGRGGKRPRDS
jgi:lupus La protein